MHSPPAVPSSSREMLTTNRKQLTGERARLDSVDIADTVPVGLHGAIASNKKSEEPK